MSVTKPWENHQKVVKKYIDDNGYDDFLREPTIKGTMFVGENDTTVEEFKRLVKNKDWDRKWESAIFDAGIGNPERFSLYPKSSGNYIHCAYHLSEYERIHGVDISELDCIVEVGCGYGAMATVCRQAGFGGEYIMFDLPIFNEIQNEYMESGGHYGGFSCITEINKLINGDVPKDSMFISTWAVSEMPTEYRDKILGIVPKFNEVLIAYQSEFEGMNIYGYFEEWQKGITTHTWETVPCVDTNHRYLFGHNFYEC
jgi:hypothetical protein